MYESRILGSDTNQRLTRVFFFTRLLKCPFYTRIHTNTQNDEKLKGNATSSTHHTLVAGILGVYKVWTKDQYIQRKTTLFALNY